MRLTLKHDDLPYLKTNLKKYHPKAGASLRMEAAARGFGFKKHSSLLRALENGPVEVEINDRVFGEFLSLPDEELESLRSLSRSMLRVAAKPFWEHSPTLTKSGFDSMWVRTPCNVDRTIPEKKAAFEQRRQEALDDWGMDQIELALLFLDKQKRRKTLNRQFSSYRLKHRAENISRTMGQFTHLGDYVSSGMLTIAAMIRGFKWQRVSATNMDAYFNISSTTVKATSPDNDGTYKPEDFLHVKFGS